MEIFDQFLGLLGLDLNKQYDTVHFENGIDLNKLSQSGIQLVGIGDISDLKVVVLRDGQPIGAYYADHHVAGCVVATHEIEYWVATDLGQPYDTWLPVRESELFDMVQVQVAIDTLRGVK